MKTLLMATAIVLSMTSVVVASEAPRAGNTLAAGPAYGDVNEFGVICWIINLGKTAITPTAETIIGQSGVVTLNNNSCGTNALAPGAICEFEYVGTGGAFTCVAQFDEPVTNLRGTLQTLDENDQGGVFPGLETVEMR
jgi:hypothetical protein